MERFQTLPQAKECQQKLTPTQLELLNDNKGKLSYFS